MNKAERNIILIVAIASILVIIFFGIYTSNLSNHRNYIDTISTNEIIKTNKIDISQIKSGDINSISALYVSKSDSLKELVHQSDLLIKGTATEIISETTLGVTTSFLIEDIIKGDINGLDTLKIVQLKDESQLKTGENYILALELDSYYDEVTYHIMAGKQGIFSIDDNKIYCDDETIQEDLLNIPQYKSDSQLLADDFINHIKYEISSLD